MSGTSSTVTIATTIENGTPTFTKSGGTLARIKIVHTTEYTYRNPVGLLRHQLMVRPDDSHDLRLHAAALKVDPEPAAVHWKHDLFDNSICFLEWPQTLRTDRLSIVSTLRPHPPSRRATAAALQP